MGRKMKSTFHIVTGSAVDHEFHGRVKLVEDHLQVKGDAEWNEWAEVYVAENPNEVVDITSPAYTGKATVISNTVIETR